MTTASASMTTRLRAMSFAHLADLSDGRGLYEHASHDIPRPEHGYCLDDVARALVVVVRAGRGTALTRQLTETYLRFVEEAVGADGSARNRMAVDGGWTQPAAMGDWWGRAVAAAGLVASTGPSLGIRVRASRVFARASRQTPLDVRTAAFAVIGAAEMLVGHPGSGAARTILARGLAVLPQTPVAGWNWPEDRLRYANATLAEALIAAGHATSDRELVRRALGFLDFLLSRESPEGHLSVTGHGGSAAGDLGRQFDQQAIEVSAMADACARAFRLTGDPRWYRGVRMAWDWFEGHNDSGCAMIDPATGAGYDGLEAGGRNENRGAESTISALNTFQRAAELGIVGGVR